MPPLPRFPRGSASFALLLARLANSSGAASLARAGLSASAPCSQPQQVPARAPRCGSSSVPAAAGLGHGRRRKAAPGRPRSREEGQRGQAGAEAAGERSSEQIFSIFMCLCLGAVEPGSQCPETSVFSAHSRGGRSARLLGQGAKSAGLQAQVCGACILSLLGPGPRPHLLGLGRGTRTGLKQPQRCDFTAFMGQAMVLRTQPPPRLRGEAPSAPLAVGFGHVPSSHTAPCLLLQPGAELCHQNRLRAQPVPGTPRPRVEERGQSQHWRRASGAVPDRVLHTPPLGALLPFFGVSDPFLGAYHTHCLSCVSSVLCHHPGVQPRAGTSGAALWELLRGPEWVLKGCLFVFPSSRALGEMP